MHNHKRTGWNKQLYQYQKLSWR